MDLIPPAPYRRLTLLDLIGLITAIGMGLYLWLFYASERSWDGTDNRFPVSMHEWIYLGSACAVPLAWVVTIREMVRPRPHPATFGAVASLAVLVATVLVFPGEFSRVSPMDMLWWDRSSLIEHALRCYIYSVFNSAAICNAIALGWLILWRLGGWHRATGSLDRLGCALGIYFLLAYAIEVALNISERIANLPLSPVTGGS